MLGIHHAAFCTADVERSMNFWRDGLRFTTLFGRTFTGDWPEPFGAQPDRPSSPHPMGVGVELIGPAQ